MLFLRVLSLSAGLASFVSGEPSSIDRRQNDNTSSVWPYQSYKSSPLTPPQFEITKSGGKLAPGLLFLTPDGLLEQSSAIIATDSGELVWSGPSGPFTNLFVQSTGSERVLTHWNGTGYNTGHGYGQVTIYDNTYTVVNIICPQLGLVTPSGAKYPCEADLHESHLTEHGTILVSAYNVTRADLRSVGGPKAGWVYDCLFFEIDLRTHKILFRWSALEHVPVASTKRSLDGAGSTQSDPLDWFHINAVQPLYPGFLVNARHTWSTYRLDSEGKIEWTIHGDDGGDFGPLPRGAQFQWQHFARLHKTGRDTAVIHWFNNYNADFDNGTAPSDGLELSLDLKKRNFLPHRALKVLRDSSDEIYADSQGSYYTLPNGNVLLGYGSIAKVKEFGPDGEVRFSARFGADNEVQSYRAYREVWHATPASVPSLVVEGGVGYVSWNGATDVTSWRIFAGNDIKKLSEVSRVQKQGFETSFAVPGYSRYVKVGAVEGRVLVRNSTVITI